MHQIYRSLFLPHVCAVFHSVLSTMIPSQWRGGGLQFQDAKMLLVSILLLILSHVPTSANQSPKQIDTNSIFALQLGMHQNFCPPSKVINDKHPFFFHCGWKISIGNTAARFRHCSRQPAHRISQSPIIGNTSAVNDSVRSHLWGRRRLLPGRGVGVMFQWTIETNLPLFKDRKIQAVVNVGVVNIIEKQVAASRTSINQLNCGFLSGLVHS